MEADKEKEIIRKLSMLETHIVNLIIPIQGISNVLTNPREIQDIKEIIKNPPKLDVNMGPVRIVLADIQRALDAFTKQIERLNEITDKFTLPQSLGELKFIGKKLHELEESIREIKEVGLKKKIEIELVVDGKEMIKKVPDNTHEKDENADLKAICDSLTSREVDVLIHRLGFFGNKKCVYRELANIVGVGAERCRAIYCKALRKLRHPTRIMLVKNCTHKLLREEVGVE